MPKRGRKILANARLPLPEDPILLPEIIDQIFLVAVHPASQGEHEEVQSVGHCLRLRGSDTAVTDVALGIRHPRLLLSRSRL